MFQDLQALEVLHSEGLKACDEAVCDDADRIGGIVWAVCWSVCWACLLGLFAELFAGLLAMWNRNYVANVLIQCFKCDFVTS